MQIRAHGSVNKDNVSRTAALKAAKAVRDAIPVEQLAVVILYASIDHEQEILLMTAREVFGETPIVGCSTAGLMSKGAFTEGGFTVGMLGLGGPGLHAATAYVEKYQEHSLEKASALGRSLLAGLKEKPKVVILHADPLCGADMESFARAVEAEVGCMVVGGGSGQMWGPMVETFQYCQGRVLNQSAVAVALAGDFVVDIATTTGTEPTPVTATVTRAEGNILLELDGRSALSWYSEFLGYKLLTELISDANTAVALGVELPTLPGESEALSPYVVRGPFGLDVAREGLIFAASVPVGTRIVFHRRSSEAALAGAELTAKALAKRLAGRTPRVVLGFECAARTAPLLGKDGTLREQLAVQRLFAPDAEWMGMLAWGELAPFGGQATYYNYTYPLLVLAE